MPLPNLIFVTELSKDSCFSLIKLLFGYNSCNFFLSILEVCIEASILGKHSILEVWLGLENETKVVCNEGSISGDFVDMFVTKVLKAFMLAH